MFSSEEQKSQPSSSNECIKENNPSLNSNEIGAILVSKLLADDDAPVGENPKDIKEKGKKDDNGDTDSEPSSPSHNAPKAFERSNDLYENFPEPDPVEEELDEWYWWTDDFVIEKPKDEYKSFGL